MSGSRRMFAVFAVGLALGASRAQAADDDFAVREQQYRQVVAPEAKKSLMARAGMRAQLARTQDPRAIPLFVEDYRQKAWADGPDRFLIASIAGRYCKGKATLAPPYAAWREKCATPADAWLWYRALHVEEEFVPGVAGAVVLDGTKEGALRAAALRVLEERLPKNTFEVVVALSKDLPNEKGGRGLLVEGMASLVATARKRIKEPGYRKALERVLAMLDDPLNSERVREFVGRRLATVFGSDVLATNGSAPWKRDFEASGVPAPVPAPAPTPPVVPKPKKPDEPLGPVFPKGVDDPDPPEGPGGLKFPKGFDEPGDGPNPDEDPDRYADAPTVFFGIASIGTRVAYVIDGSGSMSAPLSANEMEDLRKRSGADAGKGGKAVDPAADAAAIDWHRVRTRFDAAREFLKASLRRQLFSAQKEHDRPKPKGAVTGDPAGTPPTIAPPSPRTFTIVMFSRAARSLRSTPGMMPVTKANVDAAIAELDAAGPEGSTNIFGGMRRAFSTGEKGVGPMDAYADFDAIHAGCDVLFLLSDGAATADDWTTGQGVYLESDNIVEDLRRWNLLRRAEIHCVGVGEAPTDLLALIARVGGGRVVVLGKKR